MRDMADEHGRSPSRSSPEALREQGCGRRLGRYTLLRRLAQGGMAEVYLARAPDVSGFARPVAIKKILPQFNNNERFIDMLKDEAKITVSLTHPNIAQVYELGLAGDDYFIVMEYVQGRPLNKLMQRVDEHGLLVIPIPHAVHVMAEIAKGLDHAHRQTDSRGQNRNIVHRDVSPQNVLISYSGDVKLIDFGIARAEGRLNQTSQGVIKGKLRYLAPEIAAGREADHRADIFCCGIVLFEMLTGEAMFAPRSDIEAIELATEARVKSPRARNPRVPEALDAIVMKALRKDRDQRYRSALELHADLIRFLRTHDPSYGDGALAGFMRTLFRPEIVVERSLNAAATALAEEQPEMAEDPTLASDTFYNAAYQQLVTHTEIGAERAEDATVRGAEMVDDPIVLVGGADGGEAMAVVPAAVDAPGANSPFTQPPEGPNAIPFAVQVRTRTGRSARGERRDPASAAPTPKIHFKADAAAPDLEAFDIAGPADETAREMEDLSTPALGAIATERGPPPEYDAPHQWWSPTMVGPRARGSWPVWAGLASVVAIVAAVFGMMRSPAPPEIASLVKLPPATVPPSAQAAKPRAGPTPAPKVITRPELPSRDSRLTLDIEPPVPITVRLNGAVAFRGRPPAELEDVAPDRVHRVTVSADGFKPHILSRVLRPGERRTLRIRLAPQMSSIRVVNAAGAIHSSVGRVDGDRIVDVPVGSRVEVTVARPGGKPFRREVEVASTASVRLTVPPVKKVRGRGVLKISSWPVSVVYVDGKRRGRTPLSLKLRAGSHRIILESPTGETLAVRRTVKARRTTTFVYRWP